jgi:2-haloacid dehalogenase
MKRVRSGQIPWTNIDGLHRLILDDLILQFGIRGLTETEIDHFNRAWHRLWPWPDSVGGLHRLSRGYIVSTLSNGNVSLLTDMASMPGCHGIASCPRNCSRITSPIPKSIWARPDYWGLHRPRS